MPSWVSDSSTSKALAVQARGPEPAAQLISAAPDVPGVNPAETPPRVFNEVHVPESGGGSSGIAG